MSLLQSNSSRAVQSASFLDALSAEGTATQHPDAWPEKHHRFARRMRTLEIP
jgi:hypothetical protein